MINIIALYIIAGIILCVYIILRFSVKITYYVNSNTDEIELSAKWLWFNIYPRPQKAVKTNKASRKSKIKSEKIHSEEFDFSKIDNELTNQTKAELDKKIDLLEKELENQKQMSEHNEKSAEANKPLNTDRKASLNKKEKKHLIKTEKTKNNDNGLKSKINKVKCTWKKYKDYVPMTWKAFRKLLKQIRFYDTEIEITVGKDDSYDAAMLYGKINTLLFNGLSVVGLIFSLYKPKKAEVKCVFDKKVFEYEIYGKIKLRPSTILSIAICFGIKFLIIFLKKRRMAKKQYKLKRKMVLNKQKELLANEG